MKLLLRHDLECVFGKEDAPKTTITTSFYRSNIDSGYQALIVHAASLNVLDCFILDCMSALLDKGNFSFPRTFYPDPHFLVLVLDFLFF